MKRFYETVVKYDRIGAEGTIEKVTEQIVVSAVSCTDAEASVIKGIEDFVKGECDVTLAKLSKYTEYIPEESAISKIDGEVQRMLNKNSEASTEADKYFAVKVSFIETDDKGKKKKVPVHYLVYATSTDAAFRTVEIFLDDSIGDYEVNSIVETKIVDVIMEDVITKTARKLQKLLADNNMTISVNKG